MYCSTADGLGKPTAGQILELGASAGPAAGAPRAGELHAATEAPIAGHHGVQARVLGRAGLVGSHGQLHQLGEAGVERVARLQHLGERVLRRVLQRHAELVEHERLELVALAGTIHRVVRQLAEAHADALFFNDRSMRAGQGQLLIHFEAALVQTLVAVPLRNGRGVPVPGGHAAHALAHGCDVVGRVDLEALPLGGVCLPCGALHLAVGRLGAGEQLDELLALFVLGLVFGHLEHHAQLTEAGG